MLTAPIASIEGEEKDMWRMHDGDRVFSDPEWAVFRTGLDLLRAQVEQDIDNRTDFATVGIAVFDRLTPEQKLALLAEVAAALCGPELPTPQLHAASEGAIMAAFVTFNDMLRAEVEMAEAGRTDLRRLLLVAATGPEGWPGRLPKPASRNWDAWDQLYQQLIDRVFWDRDFELGDEFLDLPPEEAKCRLDLLRIDPDYYLTIPPEPDPAGLVVAKHKLAKLIGLPFPDDEHGHVMPQQP
jgi:hypothetical protein